MKLLKTIIILTLFFACKNTNSTETPKNPPVEVDTLAKARSPKAEKIWYYATVDKLRMREEPNKNGLVLEQIKEGEQLLFLNEKTDETERIKLRDKWFVEPWLKVESEKGTAGWVYGGAVSLDLPKEKVSQTPYDACDAGYAKNQEYRIWFDCYEKVSKAQVKKDARYIKPTKTGYQVNLLGGESINLVNENGDKAGEDYREYYYRYYLDKIGYFVFRVQGYESGSFVLIDDKFGYAFPVNGMPRLSPDMKKLLISNSDGDAGFEFNGVQMLSITDEGLNPEPVFEEHVDFYQPLNPVWIDDKTVEFDYVPFYTTSDKKKLKAKLIERDNGEWDLRLVNLRE